MKSKILHTSCRTAMPAITAALAAAGLIGSAQAALQTAGALLVNVDATTLPVGPLGSIANAGTMGGVFEAGGSGASIAAVYGTGTKGILFDGNGFLQHKDMVGGVLKSADPGLTGVNPTASIEAWVLNPSIPGEETIVSWGHRNGPDGSNMSFNYGYDARWGAIGHWGSPDIGWDSCCNSTGGSPPGVPAAGQWHHLVYTFDGTTQKIYIDGVLKNSENITLNTWPVPPITIAGQLEDDAGNVTGALRGSLTIGRVRIHQEALTAGNVANNYNFEKADFTGVASFVNMAPIHRYRFANAAGGAPDESPVTDSIGTAHGTVQGAGAVFTGTRVTIPGGSSADAAYIDLPNGLLSVNSSDSGGSGQITLEGWTKVTGNRQWSRILDFGSTDVADPGLIGGEVFGPGGGGEGLDYIFYDAQNNVNTTRRDVDIRNTDPLPAVGGGVGPEQAVGFDTPNFDRDFHWAITWDENGGVIRVYENGNEVGSFGVDTVNNRFSKYNDVNVWLGRSAWSGDQNMQGEYDEFRIYNKVLSAEEVARSASAGPAQLHLPGVTPAFDKQPVDVTVQEQNTATFTVETRGESPMTFQWYRGVNPIPGANAQSYSLVVAASDNGAQFRCRAQNALGNLDSAVARLNVLADTTAPTLVGAAGGTAWGLDDTHFGIRFSEPINTADATTLANYTVSGITLVPGPLALMADNVTVVGFTTATSLKGPGCKSIAITGVIRDRAPGQNPVALPASAGIVYAEGRVRYQRFNNSGAGFPNNPDVITYNTKMENPEGGGDHGDNYRGQAVALLAPPATGPYTFYIASDDNSQLFLSTDDNPANKVQISREPNWAEFRVWTGVIRSDGSDTGRGNPQANISAPITLTAGCRYYLEFVYNEGGGGDYCSVTWRPPGAPVPPNGSEPIGGLYLSPYEAAPSIPSNQPADQTVVEGSRLTLTANITGSPILTIQWFRGPDPIAGANAATYITDPLKFPDDNGATFHVEVMNTLGSAVSRTATITVTDDNTPPLLLKGLAGPLLDIFSLKFSEIMDKNSAEDAFNYTVNGNNPASAVLSPDGTVVTLTFGPQTANTDYMVHIENVQDFSGNAIVPADVVIRSVIQACGGVNFQAFLGIGGNNVADLTSHPNFPNNPQVVATVPNFDSRGRFADDSVEGYGGRLRGVFLPPSSGNWIFYLRSDDASELRFNASGISPAGAVKIAEEPGCCGAFEAHVSAPIPLIAGEAYYIECLYKEGTGGDYGQVAARLQGSADALAPIQANLLGQFAPANIIGPVTLNPAIPADLSVLANSLVSFSVGATPPADYAPLCYQWERDSNDGNGFQPIASANAATYGFGPVSLADNGAKFRCVVSSIGTIVPSREALLAVSVDTNPPVCVSARVLFDLQHIDIRFSEFVESVSATDPFNYTVDGANPPSVALRPDGMSIRITLAAPLAVASQTCISIQNVVDLAGNAISPNPSTKCIDTPVISCGVALLQQYFGIPGNPPDFPNAPQFPNDPDTQSYVNLLESPTNVREDFGTRISGYLKPPVSGNYNFYLESDDLGTFMLSTDANPANAVLLCSEPQWAGPREWVGNAGGRRPGLENQSKTLFPNGIPLVAGQMYWFQALSKEGGGGDNLGVAWQIPGGPEPVNGSTPIPGAFLASLADPGTGRPCTGTINITRQPCANNICLPVPGIPPPAGGGGSALASQDFNATDGGCTVINNRSFEGPWTYSPGTGSWRSRGQNAEIGSPGPSTRLSCPAVTVTQGGNVRVSVSHRYSFEDGGGNWDGGQLQVSVNGGGYFPVAGAAFIQNGYNGSVIVGSAAELTGQPAFVSTSAGYAAGTFITSVADLGCFSPGNTISVRFLGSYDTNTRNGDPAWEIDSISMTQGVPQSGTTANFGVAASATPDQAVFIQWECSRAGGPFVAIVGANNPTYSFEPNLTDDGNCYRAVLYIAGASSVSDVACLNVTQPNTPPRFTKGPDQLVMEDAGRVCAPGWATDIQNHTIPRSRVLNFNNQPQNTELFGVAAVNGGNLKLTTPVNSVFGQLVFNLPSAQTFPTFAASWRSLIGGGGGGGADGYSFSIGTDLPYPPGYGNPGEEGGGTGLSVAVDTFDNADVEVPDVGIEINWQGSRVAFGAIPKDNPGNGIYLRKNAFVDASLTVDGAGVATFTYDGTTISANLPGFAGIAATRLMFGARTGGANDNQWIDDLTGNEWIDGFLPVDQSNAEANQTVKFVVSNNNPGLFSEQPNVAANGTLCYTLAPNACGNANVTVVAMDDGGTDPQCGGNDMSAPQTFVISAECKPDCPGPCGPLKVAVMQDSTLNFQVPICDADGDPLQFNVTQPPAHGVLVLNGNSGAATFTPAIGYCGPDGFRVRVSDGTCTIETNVAINVICSNTCPVAVAKASPNAELRPNQTSTIVISVNNSNACVTLDGSMSSDPDGDTLTYVWLADLNGDGAKEPFATGAVVTNCFDLGEHDIMLVVDDGRCARSVSLTVEVLSACEAVEILIDKVDNADLGRRNKRPLIATLKAACASFDRGNCVSGVTQLEAFQNKVRAQIGHVDAALADEIIALTQKVLDGVDCEKGNNGSGNGQDPPPPGNPPPND